MRPVTAAGTRENTDIPNTEKNATTTSTNITATSTCHNNSTIITRQDTDKLSISIGCYNYHVFKESVDYNLSQIQEVNFMCLSETRVKPSEHDLIQDTINQHVISKNNSVVPTSHNKCGMDTYDQYSCGRPYGGVATICQVMNKISYELLE